MSNRSDSELVVYFSWLIKQETSHHQQGIGSMYLCEELKRREIYHQSDRHQEYSPLQLVAMYGNGEQLQLLLKGHEDLINVVTARGDSLFDLGLSNNNSSVQEEIKKYIPHLHVVSVNTLSKLANLLSCSEWIDTFTHFQNVTPRVEELLCETIVNICEKGGEESVGVLEYLWPRCEVKVTMDLLRFANTMSHVRFLMNLLQTKNMIQKVSVAEKNDLLRRWTNKEIQRMYIYYCSIGDEENYRRVFSECMNDMQKEFFNF